MRDFDDWTKTMSLAHSGETKNNEKQQHQLFNLGHSTLNVEMLATLKKLMSLRVLSIFKLDKSDDKLICLANSERPILEKWFPTALDVRNNNSVYLAYSAPRTIAHLGQSRTEDYRKWFPTAMDVRNNNSVYLTR
jgi:hypothetical protein